MTYLSRDIADFVKKKKTDFDDKFKNLNKKVTSNKSKLVLIKSVFNKNKNNYYYNIFLEKASHELHKKLVFV